VVTIDFRRSIVPTVQVSTTTELAEKVGFWFCAVDVRGILPTNWQADILRIAETAAVAKTIVPTSVTSRESSTDLKLPVLTVGGRILRERLPWLDELYRGHFRDLAQLICSEPVATALDARYAVNLNIQRGPTMRYECHVDSNPIEGLLYVTDNSPGTGGELVVARRSASIGVQQVALDAIRIYPTSGLLYFFDARRFPHYVEPLSCSDAKRVVIAMNYYTPSSPESARPRDLNKHLFGED
jgi:hypothetical protein